MGEFDKSFLAVPAECLTSAMRTHQKCFSLRHGKKLSNHFLLVSNLKAKDGGKTIVAGNEKVIAARLSDAKFFWEQDLKKKLEIMRDELKGITFHEKLGTQFERAERMKELAREIAARRSCASRRWRSAPPSSPRPTSCRAWSASFPSCRASWAATTPKPST